MGMLRGLRSSRQHETTLSPGFELLFRVKQVVVGFKKQKNKQNVSDWILICLVCWRSEPNWS